MSEKDIAFGKIKGDKIILNAWGDQPEREIGEVKNNDEEGSVRYFLNKYDELAQKIGGLEKEISESQNKGSFLMKLLHLKDQLATHDGLGDYASLRHRLEEQELLLKELIEKNRERNSGIKKSLLEEAQAAVVKVNWREATGELHDIKSRWLKTGNAREEENDTLDKEFWATLERFFEKKKQFYEDKKLLGEKRKRDYEGLVQKAEELNFLHGKERFELVKKLRDEWKEIGNIPREDYTPLLKKFNFLLKGRPKREDFQKPDLEEFHREMDKFLQEQKSMPLRQLEGYKQSLRSYRPINRLEKDKRGEAFHKIQLLQELHFVDQLAVKRFANFHELEKSKKKSIRIGILEELITRDKNELEKYQENSANFSGGSGGLLQMIEEKLSRQQKKIAVKMELLGLFKTEQ